MKTLTLGRVEAEAVYAHADEVAAELGEAAANVVRLRLQAVEEPHS